MGNICAENTLEKLFKNMLFKHKHYLCDPAKDSKTLGTWLGILWAIQTKVYPPLMTKVPVSIKDISHLGLHVFLPFFHRFYGWNKTLWACCKSQCKWKFGESERTDKFFSLNSVDIRQILKCLQNLVRKTSYPYDKMHNKIKIRTVLCCPDRKMKDLHQEQTRLNGQKKTHF